MEGVGVGWGEGRRGARGRGGEEGAHGWGRKGRSDSEEIPARVVGAAIRLMIREGCLTLTHIYTCVNISHILHMCNMCTVCQVREPTFSLDPLARPCGWTQAEANPRSPPHTHLHDRMDAGGDKAKVLPADEHVGRLHKRGELPEGRGAPQLVLAPGESSTRNVWEVWSPVSVKGVYLDHDAGRAAHEHCNCPH